MCVGVGVVRTRDAEENIDQPGPHKDVDTAASTKVKDHGVRGQDKTGSVSRGWQSKQQDLGSRSQRPRPASCSQVLRTGQGKPGFTKSRPEVDGLCRRL